MLAVTHNSIGTQRPVTPPQAIQHALGLHLYQPTDNLRYLLQEDEGELRNILLCYERIARYTHKYADVARLHVALSPVLLEQLREPQFIEDCRHLADIPSILEGLRSAAGIEFLGTGYRHAPLPLVPPQDWDEQLRSERLTMEAEFGRVLKGYWPPAGLFTLDMVPALAQVGYEYVLLPNTVLMTPESAQADPYRSYRLCYQYACINVVPYDQGFSQAQESGLEAPWFADEVRNGVAQAPAADAPYLLATWSDGENGEWFRRPDEEHGFFGQFFSPYMEFCETGEFPVWPVHLSDYLRAYPPATDIDLKAQALAGQTPGGTGGNEELLGRLSQVTARYWSLTKAGSGGSSPSRADLLLARELILRAEDSCYLLGGGDSAQTMLGLLEKADGLLNEPPVNKAQTAVKKDKPPAQDQATADTPRPLVKVQAAAETLKPPVKTQVVAEIPEPPVKAQPAEAPKRPAKQKLAAGKAASSNARKGSRTTRKKSRKRRR
jgi:4-alpha-glucanotransferase